MGTCISDALGFDLRPNSARYFLETNGVLLVQICSQNQGRHFDGKTLKGNRSCASPVCL